MTARSVGRMCAICVLGVYATCVLGGEGGQSLPQALEQSEMFTVYTSSGRGHHCGHLRTLIYIGLYIYIYIINFEVLNYFKVIHSPFSYPYMPGSISMFEKSGVCITECRFKNRSNVPD